MQNQSISGPTPPWLVAGLGNPGVRYAGTRHNIGFRVLDEVARDLKIDLDRSARNLVYGCGRVEGLDVILAKPLAYMNLSGPPLKKLAACRQISMQRMLVIHDDIDLVFGTLKIKTKGGIGGHNGLRSLVGALGNGDFQRLRMGVGRPAAGQDVVEHVLGSFTGKEHICLDQFIDAGCRAVCTVLFQGIQAGMNQFNNMRITTSCHTTDGG